MGGGAGNLEVDFLSKQRRCDSARPQPTQQ